MSDVNVPEKELPVTLEIQEAIELAYPEELAECRQAIQQGLPVLIEADKEMTQHLYVALRSRIREDELEAVFIDGRMPEENEAPQGPMAAMRPTGMGAIIAQLRDVVRGSVDSRVLVLPHLDLLTTSDGGLTSEAREVIQLMYENPYVLFVGFTDPSFGLPHVIETLFPRRVPFIGIRRDRVRHLVTQAESRKFGRGLPAYQMYKFTSGLNVVRLRRLLPTVETEDYPDDPRRAFNLLRQATLSSEMDIPDVDLKKDIGGYEVVKEKLDDEILDLVKRKDALEDASEIGRIEKLIPRGIIFWGPPGTGKTLFAKGMATALGATVIIVSGPELKSKWVGEGERNIRNIFRQARQSAPAIIIFDEFDSIAGSRVAGATGGDKAENSMVNQLLTEMDGFRPEELVFVVATTNFVEGLDPALLRPGRFEFHLEIGYPDTKAREAILSIYNEKMGLKMTEDALAYATRMTSGITPDTGMSYSGDHLEALCRQVARDRLRQNKTDETLRVNIDDAMDKRTDKPLLTPHERNVAATHEAGHALVATYCENAPPIERVSLRSPYRGSLGVVQFSEGVHKHIKTELDLRDQLCVFYGGMEAERAHIGAPSMGAFRDVHAATEIATMMATTLGIGSTPDNGVPRSYGNIAGSGGSAAAKRVDKAIDAILAEAQGRASALITEHEDELKALRDLLLEKTTIDTVQINGVVDKA